MNAWWRISVRINRALGGQPKEPLCSRVYRQPPSLWRSTFMLVMDRAFAEPAHCRNIHIRWLDLDANWPERGWPQGIRGSDPAEAMMGDGMTAEGLAAK